MARVTLRPGVAAARPGSPRVRGATEWTHASGAGRAAGTTQIRAGPHLGGTQLQAGAPTTAHPPGGGSLRSCHTAPQQSDRPGGAPSTKEAMSPHTDRTPTPEADPGRARRGALPGISARARVLAAAGVAGAMLVAGSFALFSDSGTVRSTFSAGTLDLKFDAGQDGAPAPYLVTFDGGEALAPGVSVSQELVVFNSGSVAADLAMAAPSITGTGSGTGADLLQGVLTLTVADVTGSPTTLYDGPLATAAFADLDLGADQTQATGRTLELTVTMSATAGVAVAGQTVQVDLPFTATQSS